MSIKINKIIPGVMAWQSCVSFTIICVIHFCEKNTVVEVKGGGGVGGD